jgi:hypothetical protein
VTWDVAPAAADVTDALACLRRAVAIERNTLRRPKTLEALAVALDALVYAKSTVKLQETG